MLPYEKGIKIKKDKQLKGNSHNSKLNIIYLLVI